MDRLSRANRIKESADRLVSFCKVDAPELIIEQERLLLFRKLLNFPVDSVAQETAIRLNNELATEERDCLHEAGFYNQPHTRD